MKKNVYTVSQINTYIKNMFTQDFLLSRLYVKGEVSNCKYHSSGHIYFSLKDQGGTLSCVMFAGSRKGLAFRLEDGMQVVVLGSVNVYERAGSYQLYAREIIRDGRGALYEEYERLKKELEEMGMFAAQYKQSIPFYVKKLGVVTAPTGAAVRDIQNIALRRNPYISITLYPAKVQGEGAADSIVRGIETLDALGLDVIIVGRGGGSIEDLWAFNEEKVARAIFECRTPVISAVGHETDTTIADFVADLRAPTPSAAAELAVADIGAVEGKISSYRQSLESLLEFRLENTKNRISAYRQRLEKLGPTQQLFEKRMRLSELQIKIPQAAKTRLDEKKAEFESYVDRLHAMSPLLRLSSGYSYTTDDSGRAVTCISQAEEGSIINVHVTDGIYHARVEERETVDRTHAKDCENG